MGEAENRRRERWSLHGMSALVTGGTKGIGSLSLPPNFQAPVC
ncbi:hypothetical protein AMTRI_Chr08g161650 [Amborella trichopoda]